MHFLLNNQVEIISCDFQKDENGNFFEVSELKDFLHTPLEQGHFFWHPIKDDSYKNANDWLFNYARDIGKAIKYIKTAIRSA